MSNPKFINKSDASIVQIFDVTKMSKMSDRRKATRIDNLSRDTLLNRVINVVGSDNDFCQEVKLMRGVGELQSNAHWLQSATNRLHLHCSNEMVQV